MMQFNPLSVNDQTTRPYLRLPPPYQRIIIAAPRLHDVLQIYEILNDPRVYRWLTAPPFPYLMEHAISWLTQAEADADAIWNELEQANVESPDGPLKIVSGCPIRSILEENDDGSYTYLGDCGFIRHTFDEVLDVDERARLLQENNARPAGDLDIIWSMGDYLRPSHHGKGIMTAVVGTLLNAWGIPRMNIRCVRASVLEGNLGSVRVFEKNEFVLQTTVRDCIQMVTKGEYSGRLHTLHVLELRR